MSNNTLLSLIIDTTCQHSCVILGQNTKPLAQRSLNKFSSPSFNLTGIVKKLLATKNIQLSSLSYIATSIGPGSYMGIRNGVCVAQTLSFAANIPLIGYLSLMAYTPNKNTHFISAIDAKLRGIYFIEGEKWKDKITYKNPPSLLSIEKSLPYLQQAKLILTPHIDSLQKKFNTHLPIIKAYPNRQRLTSLTFQMFKNKEYTNNLAPKILYY